MCVVFFTVRMKLCAGLRGLCLEERKVVRREPEPEGSFVLKQSLEGALDDGFRFVWAGHDHRTKGVVPKHDAGRDSRQQALLAIQQSGNSAPLRNDDHAWSAMAGQERCQEKTRGKH